jgi:MFS family permease
MGLGSAAFLASSTVNAIVGTRLGGGDGWAGIPTATYQVGAAAAAVLWGIALDRLGRRPTLMLGMAVGAAGAALAGTAVAHHDLSWFLFGVLLMGMAQSALQLGRFVAAEVHAAADRGRAISRVVVGATVGAVFGPLAVGPAGTMAARAGLEPLSGPYAVSAVLFVLVAALLGLFLRPDPRELGRRLESAASPGAAAAPRAVVVILRDPRAALAVATMVCGQLVMTMLMVITAVHMAHHDHPLSSIAAVLSSHVFGMFAFSVLSGRLTDALGRLRVIAIGAAVLLAACAAAPLSLRVVPLAASLMLLGLGWNLCYVAGTTLLADRLTAGERGRTQGFNDFLIGSVSAAGSVLSGAVFAGAGYGWMAACGAAVSAVLLALALAFGGAPRADRAAVPA